MSRFTTAEYTVIPNMYKRGRPMVCLDSDLVYEIGYLGSGWKLTAPKGFSSDLASIPKRLLKYKWARKLADQIARASIVHDLVRSNKNFPKLLGDYVFLEAMEVDGVSFVKRVACFVLVLFNFNRD